MRTLIIAICTLAIAAAIIIVCVVMASKGSCKAKFSRKADIELPLVSAKVRGGLGNQLFELAAAYSYGRQHGRKAVLSKRHLHLKNHHTKLDYKNTIYSKWEETNEPEDDTYNETPGLQTWSWVPLPSSKGKHLHLSGYFQNEKYVKDYLQDFLNTLTLPNDVPTKDNTCFIHVRLGDYVNHNVLGLDLTSVYVPAAMAYQRKQNPDVQFIVFSNEISKCKDMQLFKGEGIEFSNETDEVQTLVEMSKCWLGGICSNSTFSWWGAYMNPNPDRVVTFPSEWIKDPPSNWNIDVQFEGSVKLPIK